MLLMVATQARKAETRQGSRKGLQAGEWQTTSVPDSPVWRAASHPCNVPHPSNGSSAKECLLQHQGWVTSMAPLQQACLLPFNSEEHCTPNICSSSISGFHTRWSYLA